MTSQGSSRADFFDLTGDEDSTPDAEPTLSQQSALAGPLPQRIEAPFVTPTTVGSDNLQNSNRAQENGVAQTVDDDSDVEMLDEGPIDEAVRQRNVENRRERLLARGIREENGPGPSNDRAGHGRGPSVAEVIVISDGEDSANNEGMYATVGGDDGDFFGEERRRRRRWNNWADDLEERLRHPNARQPLPDLFDFQFPQQLLRTPAPARIRLGGGGILSRDRPHLPPNNNPGPSMHRRSVQLDGERLQGRVRAHLDGLVREEEAEYRNLDLTGRLRNAMGRLGDVFGALGWGIGGGDDAAAVGDADPAEGWGPPGWGLDTGRARGRARGWGRGVGGLRGRVGGLFPPFEPGPPAEEEEQPLNLPEAPDWKASFTHPGKMRHGFTSDFAPVEPELIVLEDSDEETKKKKGKGKAKQPIRNLDSETGTGQTLMLVCTRCKDPLLLGGETDEERVYGLRCGHVLDGKCLWKLARPPEPQPPPSKTQKANKGKDRAGVQEAQTTMDIDPSFEFTFVPPVENLSSATTSVYQEDNSPDAALLRSRAPLRRIGGQGRRGIVPIPNASARHTRRRTRQNALDGVHDELTPDPAQEASTSATRLDISDPFFPFVPVTPQRGRGGTRGGRASGTTRGGGKTKMRKVPKTRGKLKEEVFEWTCPVPGCGREHISVRLDMEGARWKSDPDKGAILMFL